MKAADSLTGELVNHQPINSSTGELGTDGLYPTHSLRSLEVQRDAITEKIKVTRTVEIRCRSHSAHLRCGSSLTMRRRRSDTSCIGNLHETARRPRTLSVLPLLRALCDSSAAGGESNPYAAPRACGCRGPHPDPMQRIEPSASILTHRWLRRNVL